jgi:hypothetical protein
MTVRAGASNPSGLQIYLAFIFIFKVERFLGLQVYLLECLLFITRVDHLSGQEGLPPAL